MAGVMTKEPLAWALSGFYFLTFGGFVAFSIYLPTLLRDQFNLSMADAGLRTARFRRACDFVTSRRAARCPIKSGELVFYRACSPA